MNFLALISFFIWLYILTVLKRGKLDFWYFCAGSVGIFVFMMIWLQPMLTLPLVKAVTVVSGMLGKLTGFFEGYFQYGILFIQNKEGAISLYIDYECSGIIEVMAFVSMLLFFPAYYAIEKVIVGITGFLYIFIANVLRVFIICMMVHFLGNDIYFIAHTIIGRIVFYSFSVVLYFYVFTKAQIVRQKVGNFKYGDD